MGPLAQIPSRRTPAPGLGPASRRPFPLRTPWSSAAVAVPEAPSARGCGGAPVPGAAAGLGCAHCCAHCCAPCCPPLSAGEDVGARCCPGSGPVSPSLGAIGRSAAAARCWGAAGPLSAACSARGEPCADFPSAGGASPARLRPPRSALWCHKRSTRPQVRSARLGEAGAARPLPRGWRPPLGLFTSSPLTARRREGPVLGEPGSAGPAGHRPPERGSPPASLCERRVRLPRPSTTLRENPGRPKRAGDLHV